MNGTKTSREQYSMNKPTTATIQAADSAGRPVNTDRMLAMVAEMLGLTVEELRARQ